jgi:hypothetical protein
MGEGVQFAAACAFACAPQEDLPSVARRRIIPSLASSPLMCRAILIASPVLEIGAND